ncbi:hypothetical protein ZEAMMB73_Zm00001d005571 [Zea mays]|uniref:Myb/SANT-like domain-containing protein n=1 Tax=Zea mays TaxID=4577 RepID=A0A1D6ENV5_MAIZE|nr:hypothetical protein ZEAMMB73_Zm00001d005571 [Zea mays]
MSTSPCDSSASFVSHSSSCEPTPEWDPIAAYEKQAPLHWDADGWDFAVASESKGDLTDGDDLQFLVDGELDSDTSTECSCISLPNLAHSFTDSCSPDKPARDKRTAPVQYNLRKKRAKTTSTMSSSDRASWDPMITKIFIDLCINQKDLNNFNSMGLTKYGWQQVYRSFREQTGLDYDNKKLQNKLNLLRRSFQQWQYLQNHTGLGLEPRTGDIAADDSYWGTQEGVHCS